MKYLALVVIGLLALMAAPPAAAHEHFAAGFSDTNGNKVPDKNEPLRLFGNYAGQTFRLLPRPFGFRPAQRCGGYYALDEQPRELFPLDAFSFTALSDGQFDAKAPDHAHTGSWIWMEIVSVAGPEGANFGFWDEDWSYFHDEPTVSLPANRPVPAGTRFVLSTGFDDPGEDPFGHIHGRAWTVDRPGDYYVGFRLVDLSHSAPDGGPWHTPSAVYVFHFKAGPSFQPAIERLAGGGSVQLTWGSQMGIYPPLGHAGITFTVKRATALAPADWTTIGTVTGTTAETATFTDTSPPAGRAFYRLEYPWSVP